MIIIAIVAVFGVGGGGVLSTLVTCLCIMIDVNIDGNGQLLNAVMGVCKDVVSVFYRKDVRLPVQLQRAMATEAEAQREARAKVCI